MGNGTGCCSAEAIEWDELIKNRELEDDYEAHWRADCDDKRCRPVSQQSTDWSEVLAFRDTCCPTNTVRDMNSGFVSRHHNKITGFLGFDVDPNNRTKRRVIALIIHPEYIDHRTLYSLMLTFTESSICDTFSLDSKTVPITPLMERILRALRFQRTVLDFQTGESVYETVKPVLQLDSNK